MLFVIFAVLCLTVVQSASLCHNITGTCFAHGFECADGTIVKPSERCDGVEQCADGTDEYLCHHEDDRPLHERPEHERHSVTLGSCARCTCYGSTQIITLSSGTGWANYAKIAPISMEMLGSGQWRNPSGPPFTLSAGTVVAAKRIPCNARSAAPTSTNIRLSFYRKTGICRGWVCCARQDGCKCGSGSESGSGNDYQPNTRCYV